MGVDKKDFNFSGFDAAASSQEPSIFDFSTFDKAVKKKEFSIPYAEPSQDGGLRLGSTTFTRLTAQQTPTPEDDPAYQNLLKKKSDYEGKIQRLQGDETYNALTNDIIKIGNEYDALAKDVPKMEDYFKSLSKQKSDIEAQLPNVSGSEKDNLQSQYQSVLSSINQASNEYNTFLGGLNDKGKKHQALSKRKSYYDNQMNSNIKEYNSVINEINSYNKKFAQDQQELQDQQIQQAKQAQAAAEPVDIITLARLRKRHKAESMPKLLHSGAVSPANIWGLGEVADIESRLKNIYKLTDQDIEQLDEELKDVPIDEMNQWSGNWSTKNLSELRGKDYPLYRADLELAKIYSLLKKKDTDLESKYKDIKENIYESKVQSPLARFGSKNEAVKKQNEAIMASDKLSDDEKEKLIGYNNKLNQYVAQSHVSDDAAKKYINDLISYSVGFTVKTTPTLANGWTTQRKYEAGEDIDAIPLESIAKIIRKEDPFESRAFEVYNANRSFNEVVKTSPSIEEAALNYYSRIDPTLAGQRSKLQEGGYDLPPITKGEYVNAFLQDPKTKAFAEKDPQFKVLYRQALFGFSINYPEYAAKLVAEKISQAREDRGYNNFMINVPTESGTRELVDDMVANGELSEQDRELYMKYIDPEVGVGQSFKRAIGGLTGFTAVAGLSPIKTPDVVGNALEGFHNTMKKTARSIEDLPYVNLVMDNDAYRMYNTMTDNAKALRVNFTKAHEISEATGNLLGFVIPMIAGSGGLQAAGLTEGAAHLVTSGLMFEGGNKDNALVLFPNDQAKRITYTALTTAVDMWLTELLPTKYMSRGISKVFGKDVAEITNKLLNKEITPQIATRTLVDRLTSYLPKFATENAKQAAIISAFSTVHKAIDGLYRVNNLSVSDLALDYIKEVKHNYLTTPILTALALKGKTNSPKVDAKVLMEMGGSPEYYKKLVLDYAEKNNESKEVTEEKLQNLNNAAGIFADMQKVEGLTQPQKDKFFVYALAEKGLLDQASKTTDLTLKKKYKEQAEGLSIVKENILNGKDQATEFNTFQPVTEQEQQKIDEEAKNAVKRSMGETPEVPEGQATEKTVPGGTREVSTGGAEAEPTVLTSGEQIDQRLKGATNEEPKPSFETTKLYKLNENGEYEPSIGDSSVSEKMDDQEKRSESLKIGSPAYEAAKKLDQTKYKLSGTGTIPSESGARNFTKEINGKTYKFNVYDYPDGTSRYTINEMGKAEGSMTLEPIRDVSVSELTQEKTTEVQKTEKETPKIETEKETPQVTELPKTEEKEPTVSGVEQKEVVRQMKPITDRMVDIEREFENNGLTIDTDYDNEIIVTDKDGEIVDPEDVPENLRSLAADYENATRKLGEFDDASREIALNESRKVTETTAEEVKPAELPEGQRPKTYTIDNLNEISTEGLDKTQAKVVGAIKNIVKSVANLVKGTGKTLSVTVHTSPESYTKAVLDAGGTRQDSNTKGFYLDSNGAIHLNMNKVTSETMHHEAFHPVLDFMEANSPETVDKIYEQLNSFGEGKSFIESNQRRYKGETTQKKEAITDFIAHVADGSIVINPSNFARVKKFIVDTLNKLGFDLKTFKTIDVKNADELVNLAKNISEKFKTGEEITIDEGGKPLTKSPVEISLPKFSKDKPLGEEVKVGNHASSFVKKSDIINIEDFLRDVANKKQKIWFWVADQLGRGFYKDEVIKGEHYLDAGPSFALDPENRDRNVIWATGKGNGWVENNIKNSDYIGIISGSPEKSKLFNKTVFDLFAKRAGDFNKFKRNVLKNSKISELNTLLKEFNSFDELKNSPKRKDFLILIDAQKSKNTPLTQYLEKSNAFIDYNSLRDGFYADNNFGMNDIMLILKPESFGGESNHSTYENDVLGEVIGVPDKKVNAYTLLPEDIKKKYELSLEQKNKEREEQGKAATPFTETQKSQIVAPYGSGIKEIQFSREKNENEDIVTASVNVAPLYSTKVSSAEQAGMIHESPLYQEYKKENERVASMFGLEVVSQQDGVGGYEFSNGQAVMEATTIVNVKGKFSDIVEYAAINGALTPEVQDATIAGMYVKKNSEYHNADKVEVKIDNMDAAMKAAKDAGFDRAGFTLVDGEISFFNVFFHPKESVKYKEQVQDFKKKVVTFVNKYKEYGGKIISKGTRAVRSEYIDNVRRREILDRITESTVPGGQGRAGIRDALATAKERNTRYTTWKYIDKSESAKEYRSLRQKQFDLAAEGKSLSDAERTRLSDLEKRISKLLTTTYATKSERGAYEQAKAEVDAIANDVAQLVEDGYRAEFPTKRPSRAAIKTVRWYDSQPNLLGDGARTNVIVNTDVDANFLYDELQKKFPSATGRTERVTTELGYPKRLIEIRTKNGKLAEVQVMTPQGYLAKDGIKHFPKDARSKAQQSLKEVQDRLGWGIPDGVGHYFYEINRDVNVPKTLRDQAAEISNKYYDAFLNPESKLTDQEFRTAIEDFKSKVDAADKSKWDEGNNGKSPEELDNYLSETEGEPQFSKVELPNGEKVTAKDTEEPEVINGFYSPVEKKVLSTKQNNLSATKWLNELGRTKDETVYTGLKDFLESKRPDQQVTKQELLDYMKNNRIEVREVVKVEPKDRAIPKDVINTLKELDYLGYDTPNKALSYIRGDKNWKKYFDTGDINTESLDNYIKETAPPKYEQYQLPGEKENYKEVLITLPENTPLSFDEFKSEYQQKTALDDYEIEAAYKNYLQKGDFSRKFKSSHYQEPNIAVHLRMNTRTDAEGNKVLFLEEVQSDWGQKGKREGFQKTKQEIESEYEKADKELDRLNTKFDSKYGVDFAPDMLTPEEYSEYSVAATNRARLGSQLSSGRIDGTTKAPFITDTNAWTKLGLKYAIQHAIKEGADKIVWTTGEQQNERYDLSKSIKRVDFIRVGEDRYKYEARGLDGKRVAYDDNGTTSLKEIEGMFGKDIAEKVKADKSGDLRLEGEGLKVGGKGMIGFYGSPEQGKEGVVGSVAKALVKELTGKEGKIGETKLDTKSIKLSSEAEKKMAEEGWTSGEPSKEEYSTQHSIEITPELKASAEKGMPQFSREELPEEESKPEPKKVGLSKAEITKQVEEFSMLPPEKMAKVPDAELDEMADAAISSGYNVQELVDRLNEYKGSLFYDPEAKNWVERAEVAPANPLEVTILNKYAAALNAEQTSRPSMETLKKYTEVMNAARKAFNIAGSTLRQARRSQIVADNVSNFLVDKEVAQGSPLTENQLKVETEKYNELQKQKEELKSQLEVEKQKNIEHEAEIARLKAKKTSSRASVKKSDTEYKQERKSLVEKAREAILRLKDKNKGNEGTTDINFSTEDSLRAEATNKLMAIAPTVKEMMDAHLGQGVQKLEDIVNAIHEDIKQLDDVTGGISKSEIIEIISGRHDAPPIRTKNELVAKRRLMKREAELLLQIQEARKNVESARQKKDDKKEIQNNKRIKELEEELARIKQFNKESQEMDQEIKEETNEQRLAKKRKQLLNAIERMERQLKNKEYLDEAPEPVPLKLDAKTKAMMDRYVSLQNRIKEERMKDRMERESAGRKAFRKVMDVLGIRRAMQTAFDVSVSLRQGAPILKPGTAGIWWKAFMNQIASMKASNYNVLMHQIGESELYYEMVEDGIVFNDIKSPNEDYANTNIVNKVPGIKLSQRAADGFLNTARFELYMKFKKNLEAAGLTRQTDHQAFKDAAKWAMNMTGRGNLIKSFESSDAQSLLGNTFFGARLMASRFNMLNPVTYIKMHPEMRKQAMVGMVSWVSTLMTVGYGLSKIPGVSVSLNPDDSDFLQIRYKNRVYDLSAGFSPYIRTALRLAESAVSVFDDPKYMIVKKNKQAGVSTLRFFRNKLAPNPSYAVDFIFGSDRPQGFNPYDVLKAYPMYVDDVVDAWKQEGAWSLLTVLLPNVIGIGYGSYNKKGELETDLNKLLQNQRSATYTDYSGWKNYNDTKNPGRTVTEKEFLQYAEKVDREVDKRIEDIYKNGTKVVTDLNQIEFKKYSEMTADQVGRAIESSRNMIENKIKNEMFGKASGYEYEKELLKKNLQKVINAENKSNLE